MEIPRTLLVTNDFPPAVGGIQRTLGSLAQALPADRIAVLAPGMEGAAAFDAGAPFEVIRVGERFLWPTPALSERVRQEIRRLGIEVVLFGDAMPLALHGPGLADAGTPYLVATHGFDYWLSTVPIAHGVMRRMTARASHVVVMCSEFVARRVRTAVPRRVPVSVLYPGADLERFAPDLPTEDLRSRLALDGRPTIVSVSRLVPRKGQDVLIRSLPEIRKRVPDATLVIVGTGPAEDRLRRLAGSAPPGSVVFAGAASEEELPRHYALGHVFAMPCRSRFGGLEIEGWGNVFIEAAACARPVVVGDSGGARESLVHEETGLLVDGTDRDEVADAISSLLEDPAYGAQLGKAGRARVERDHTWSGAAARLAGWLRAAVER